MWHIRHTVTNGVLLNEKPILRELVSVVILLPKDLSNPKIRRLCIINTYESNYNMILKYFWVNISMRAVVRKNDLKKIN